MSGSDKCCGLLAFLASTHYLHTPEIVLLKLFHLWRHTNVHKARSYEFGLLPKSCGLKSLTVTLLMTQTSNWPLCVSISSLKGGVDNYRACFVGLSNGLEGCLLEKPLHVWLMFLNTSFTQIINLRCIYLWFAACPTLGIAPYLHPSVPRAVLYILCLLYKCLEES